MKRSLEVVYIVNDGEVSIEIEVNRGTIGVIRTQLNFLRKYLCMFSRS